MTADEYTRIRNIILTYETLNMGGITYVHRESILIMMMSFVDNAVIQIGDADDHGHRRVQMTANPKEDEYENHPAE